MRDLQGLRVRLIVSLSIFLISSMFAEDGMGYLTKEKQKSLQIEDFINKKSATTLKYDWIEPIVASYSYSKSNQIGRTSSSKYFRISFNQPIFKSGGIYFAIQYSKANRAFKDIAYRLKKSGVIKSLYDGVLNLKKLDLQIQKAKLSIENAKIDIDRKREQFESGVLDSSFLDSAILKKSSLEHQLLNFEALRFQALNSFKNISDVDYRAIELPDIKSITKEQFLERNLDIAKLKKSKEQANELKNMTISNYLPTISLYGDYNYKDDDIQLFKQSKEYKNYGARVSMPIFSINRGRNIEIKKLELLKSKIELKEQIEASKREYLSLSNNIELLKKRVEISKGDVNLYDQLLKSAKDGVTAGEKTISDLKTLENSKGIAAIDTKIYDIDRELEILKLYEKMSDAL